MSIAFLEEALLSETTVGTGEFALYRPESASDFLENMVLDSQALEHLELLKTSGGKVEGSLFHYLDHCKTQFGKRLLRRWLLSPLLTPESINARLDAVDDLIAHTYETDVFRAKIGRLPDLEKLLAKLYTYSVKHKVKAIYFENVSLNKLREFRTLCRTLRSLPELIASVDAKKFRSERLRTLLIPDVDGGLYPS